MGVYDKIWLRVNKKARPRWLTYFNLVFIWFVAGFIMGGFSVTGSLLGKPLEGFLIGLGIAFLLALVATLSDVKLGYYSSIHIHYLERREKKTKENE